MLARMATVSDTNTIQRSSPRDSNSTLIAEISSMRQAHPGGDSRPRSHRLGRRRGHVHRPGAPLHPAQHHIGVRPVQTRRSRIGIPPCRNDVPARPPNPRSAPPHRAATGPAGAGGPATAGRSSKRDLSCLSLPYKIMTASDAQVADTPTLRPDRPTRPDHQSPADGSSLLARDRSSSPAASPDRPGRPRTPPPAPHPAGPSRRRTVSRSPTSGWNG